MKYNVEFDLPNKYNEQQLNAAAKTLVTQLRAVFNTYKSQGNVPTFSCRQTIKETKKGNTERKKFTDELFNYAVKYMPNLSYADQIRSMNKLYDLGMTVEQAIEMFDRSHQSYNLTTWHTVVYRIRQSPVETTFSMPVEQQQELLRRLKTVCNDEES